MSKTFLQERVFLWDNLKCLLILCVVIGHFISVSGADTSFYKSCYLLIYSFHMPLFVFISGFFSKNTIITLNWDRLIHYVYLYLFIKIWGFIVGLITFKRVPVLDLINAPGMEWYVLALCFCTLLTIVFKNYEWKAVLAISILLACFIGYSQHNPDVLAIHRTIVFFPFFYLGYLTESETIKAINRNKWVKLPGALIVGAALAICILKVNDLYWMRTLLSGHNPYSTLETLPFLGGFVRLLWYLYVFIFGMCMLTLVPDKQYFFSVVGKNSLVVYIFHGTLIYFFLYYLRVHSELNSIFPGIGHKYIFVLSLVIVFILGTENIVAKILKQILKPLRIKQ